MSLIYKIGQNDFDAIFFPDSPERACFRCKLFCTLDIFQIISLDYNIRNILLYLNIFSKTSTLNNVKRKRVLLSFVEIQKISPQIRHTTDNEVAQKDQLKMDGFCMT